MPDPTQGDTLREASGREWTVVSFRRTGTEWKVSLRHKTTLLSFAGAGDWRSHPTVKCWFEPAKTA